MNEYARVSVNTGTGSGHFADRDPLMAKQKAIKELLNLKVIGNIKYYTAVVNFKNIWWTFSRRGDTVALSSIEVY